jgi:hypothetical protein
MALRGSPSQAAQGFLGIAAAADAAVSFAFFASQRFLKADQPQRREERS